jgi:phage gp36-like protein
MATYCDVEDLGRFGVNAQALEDISAQDGQAPPIEGASRFMDGYLGKQFTLPFVPDPLDPVARPGFGDDIRECCAVITAWRVLRVRGIKPGENPEDSALYLDYKEKIRWLEQIAAGKVTPVVTASASAISPGAPSGPMVTTNVSRGWQSEGVGDSGVPFSGRRR